MKTKSILLVGLLVTAVVILFAFWISRDRHPKLTLNKGDRVVIIGNTTAERMQYFGHFETLLHARFPEHELVVRNLGYSGDEVKLRPRSLNFGSPDQHLSMWEADVIIAFFGFNESFRGEDGLEPFEAELEEFITHTLSQRYNGESSPRLALVSPIAHEDLDDPSLPDGSETNPNLELYSRTMSRLAAEYDVTFVDLLTASRRLMEESAEPVTINGVHLSDYGYAQLAPVLADGLFGPAPEPVDIPAGLRAEVNEKNFFFFHRYRAVNGYYIYGGRSQRDHGNPPFTDAYVMENERRKLDDMVANRDRRIWQAAQGLSVPVEVDDSNTRPLYDVPTNFHQPLNILSPEEALKTFDVADGYAVNLFASEQEFPELANPHQMTFDSKGRLWVLTMPDYPMFQPPERPNARLVNLEDTDGDGKADKLTVFADGLHVPTGFELGDNGVYVAQQPNLIFLRDTDGDGQADLRELILHGFDSADSHHSISAFAWGPGGGLYMCEGTFNYTSVETPYGPVRNAHGGVYRYQPESERFETFIHYNFANPWGHVFDKWGQDFVADASGGSNYFAAPFSIRAPQYDGSDDFGPFKFVYRDRMRTFIEMRVRPTSGAEFVSSRHFPPEAQGNFLLNNVIGFQGILQHTMKDEGSGFVGTEIEPLLQSSDRNFRPVALQFGPDGALYVVDWYNPLVGHMQHNLRDPNRDTSHGRVWRITYPSRPLLDSPVIDGQPVAVLLDLLKAYEDRVRYRVRRELGARERDGVLAETQKWIETLDRTDEEYEHHLLEALWLYQQHDVVNQELLERMLESPEFRARAAATRVLSYWRDRVENSLELLRMLIADDHPRVRLEAVRALSFFDDPAATEIALEVFHKPTDFYIEYALNEAIRIMEPSWKSVVLSGEPFAENNPAGIEYLLSRLSDEEVVAMARSRPVYKALLIRPGIDSEHRKEAAAGLARLNETREADEVLKAIRALDGEAVDPASESADKQTESEQRLEAVLVDLVGVLSEQEEIRSPEFRSKLEELADSGRHSVTRQMASVALLSAGKRPQALWEAASHSPDRLHDLISAIPRVSDSDVRAGFSGRLEGLLSDPGSSLPDGPVSQEKAESIRTAGIQALVSIPGHEERTYQILVPYLDNPHHRHAAVRALQELSLDEIPADEIEPSVASLIDYIASVPPGERTSSTGAEATVLADELLALLPDERAVPLQSRLDDLRVQVIVIRPIPHAMKFDRQEFYVVAGKPVEILFENTDIMPHNLLVTVPGALVDVGLAAEEMSSQPDAFEKHFVPDTPKVLFASRLLQPGEKEAIQFTAPEVTEDHPYVCTFPGHWQTMNGLMHVVASADEIPEDQSRDEPVHVVSRQFVREWTVDDLQPALRVLDHDRNFELGGQLYREIGCHQCHQINGEGGEIGPDLTDVKRKLKDGEMDRTVLLREVVDPSHTVAPEYRSEVIRTTDGLLFSGIIEYEDDHVVRFAPNPLVGGEAEEVAKETIERRWESKSSIMPQGLVNTLTEREIMDLLAYVASGGGLQPVDQEHRHTSD